MLNNEQVIEILRRHGVCWRTVDQKLEMEELFGDGTSRWLPAINNKVELYVWLGY